MNTENRDVLSRCPACDVGVAGRWRSCPLCRGELEVTGDNGQPETYPNVPLRFERTKVLRLLLLLSSLFVLGSFAGQWLLPTLAAPVRTVWLWVAVAWLVVLASIQRRRNVGSLIAWLLVLLSLAALGWNQFAGPELWATTWAIPAICTAANLTLGILLWVVRLNPAEYLSKAVLVAAVGMVPGLFVLLGWVANAVPSLVCVGFSLVVTAMMVIFRPRQVGSALHRRLQL